MLFILLIFIEDILCFICNAKEIGFALVNRVDRVDRSLRPFDFW
jgi:hypothetical protein